MIVIVKTVEGKCIANTDIIDIKTFEKVINEIKKEWLKNFIKKEVGENGLNRFTVINKDGDNIYSFNENEYDSMISHFCNDSDYYTKMPMDMILKKFIEKGFICRLTKVDGHTYII